MTSHQWLSCQALRFFWTKVWINTGKAMQQWNPSCNAIKQMRVAREIRPRTIQLALWLGNAFNLRSSEAEGAGEHGKKNVRSSQRVPKEFPKNPCMTLCDRETWRVSQH